MGQIEGLDLEYIVQRNYWIQSLHLRVKAFIMPQKRPSTAGGRPFIVS